MGFQAFPISVSWNASTRRKLLDWKPAWGETLSLPLVLDWLNFLGNGCNGIAIKTGVTSNLTVIDGDTKNGVDGISPLSHIIFSHIPSVKTPTGRHWWFAYSSTSKTSSDRKRGMDIRNDGAFAICPPSVVTGYGVYEWVVPLKMPLQKMPIAVVNHVRKKSENRLPAPEGRKLISDLTKPQCRILREKINRCKIAPIGSRSEPDFAVCCWAVKIGLSPENLWQLVHNIGKFADRGREYFNMTYENALRTE